MLVNVFRWICGYVSFCASGGFPEKFLNLVNKKKINLWDLKKSNGDLYAKVLNSDYKFLRGDAKKANCKIEIIKKYGLPVFTFKYKRRIGVAIGVVVFLTIIQIFSLFIWNINVQGNSEIKSEDVISVISELGVGVGTKKSSINSAILKQLIMAKLTDISWISVNINGSCLNICIKEKIKSPEILKEGEACNIVAKSDGQIEHMEVYKGDSCVNAGDAVVKGQILISGAARDASGGTVVSEARGRVFAQTKRKLVESVKLCSIGAADSGKVVKKHKIKAFEKEIPVNPWCRVGEDYRTEVQESQISFFGVKLPVIISTEVCHQQICDEKFLTKEEAEKILEKNISEREKTEFENVKIISKSVNNYQQDNDYISEVTYSCIEDIAKKQGVS